MFTQWIAKNRWVWLAAGLSLSLSAPLFAQVRTVELPLTVSDAFGTQWDIQPNGIVGDGGQDQFDMAADLFINDSNNYNMETTRGEIDEKTRELRFPSQDCGGVQVSRRVYVDSKNGFCRWVESIANPSNNPATVSVFLRSGIGRGISSMRYLNPSKQSSRNYGLTVGNTGFGFAFIGSGRNSKFPVQLSANPQNMCVTIRYNLTIPPKKTLSVAHAVFVRNSSQKVSKSALELPESVLLENIPPEILKTIVNFKLARGLGLELDLLRPAGHDAIELTGGDQFLGSLRQDPLVLDSPVGKISIPLADLAGLVSVNDARKSFLAVLKDDQVLSGKLPQSLPFVLNDQKEISIPVERITRIGLKQSDPQESENKPFFPMFALRSGPVYRIASLDGNLDLQTRFGRYLIPFAKINKIIVADETVDSANHEIHLVDGSILRGFALNSSISFKGDGLLKDKTLQVPLASILALELAKPLGPLDPSASALGTVSEDTLVGALKGTLALSNELGKFPVEASQLRRFEPIARTESDVNALLWDNTRLQGDLADVELIFQTACGLEFKIPLGVVLAYDQPIPEIPKDSADDIRARLTRILALNDDARNSQLEKLQSFGPGVISILRSMGNDLPDAKRKILSDFEESLKPVAVRAPFRPQEPEQDEFVDPDSNPPFFDEGFPQHDFIDVPDFVPDFNKDGMIDFGGEELPPPDFFNKP